MILENPGHVDALIRVALNYLKNNLDNLDPAIFDAIDPKPTVEDIDKLLKATWRFESCE